MWKDSFFWFSPPSSFLNNYDHYFFWSFVALTVVGLILKIAQRFMSHAVLAKVINKFANLGLTLGISGLIWFAFRYENTPIFADRYWAGLIWLLAIVWLILIVKYLIMSFGREKREFERSVVNSRYIPSKK